MKKEKQIQNKMQITVFSAPTSLGNSISLPQDAKARKQARSSNRKRQFPLTTSLSASSNPWNEKIEDIL
jgi:LAS superfamily LD-carboxypeptidase LdcB